MKKLDVQTLGEMIVEYQDGKPFTSMISPIEASRQVAEKVNEIIDWIEQEKSQP